LPEGAEELELSLWADAQAFALLRERFPGTPTLVVYLPGPLSTYRLTSPEVDLQVQRGDGPTRFPRRALAELSDHLCRRIAEITLAGDGEFVDLRPALWELALHEPIHGPRDWKHLNRIGQERLAEVVATRLNGAGADTCASLRVHLGG